MFNPYFYVKKYSLLLIAGIVWLVAGFNVMIVGFKAYSSLNVISFLLVLLTIIVFVLFEMMFYKIVVKNHLRIKSFNENKIPFWRFFDTRSYIIMFFMMTGGMFLRSSGLISETFISFFYTGLGLALAFAGIISIYYFWAFKE